MGHSVGRRRRRRVRDALDVGRIERAAVRRLVHGCEPSSDRMLTTMNLSVGRRNDGCRRGASRLCTMFGASACAPGASSSYVVSPSLRSRHRPRRSKTTVNGKPPRSLPSRAQARCRRSPARPIGKADRHLPGTRAPASGRRSPSPTTCQPCARALAVEAVERGHLVHAGCAPGGPEVQHQRLGRAARPSPARRHRAASKRCAHRALGCRARRPALRAAAPPGAAGAGRRGRRPRPTAPSDATICAGFMRLLRPAAGASAARSPRSVPARARRASARRAGRRGRGHQVHASTGSPSVGAGRGQAQHVDRLAARPAAAADVVVDARVDQRDLGRLRVVAVQLEVHASTAASRCRARPRRSGAAGTPASRSIQTQRHCAQRAQLGRLGVGAEQREVVAHLVFDLIVARAGRRRAPRAAAAAWRPGAWPGRIPCPSSTTRRAAAAAISAVRVGRCMRRSAAVAVDVRAARPRPCARRWSPRGRPHRPSRAASRSAWAPAASPPAAPPATRRAGSASTRK